MILDLGGLTYIGGSLPFVRETMKH